MTLRAWWGDILFFVLMFLGISALMLLVNVITSTWNGVSGHALATVLAGLLLVKCRWGNSVPKYAVVMVFSVIAGFSAILYLFLLQLFAGLSWWFSFDPLRGYELALAFVINAVVFAATMWIRGRMMAKQ